MDFARDSGEECFFGPVTAVAVRHHLVSIGVLSPLQRPVRVIIRRRNRRSLSPLVRASRTIGTPDVARRAAFHNRKQPMMPMTAEKMMESKLMTEKSTSPLGLPVERWVR